ncbi:alpha/beta hydrolase [Pseudoxanthomonas sp. 10H]|uniref:alpha/beta hydrolase n=1 Tax=Pseudoxanthomonas sp. 10H TaxID=3242729 RepID=UPI0035563414
MRAAHARILLVFVLFVACVPARAMAAPGPRIESIPGGAGQPMQVHVFAPRASAPRAAIVLFHGGGWAFGDASWIHGTARWLAEAGMVAVSVEYRLSDPGGGGSTPFDAVADARAAIRWVRQEAARLGVDPGRIAAGGVSAGAHLAAATAAFDEPFGGEVSARPDLLVLWSPAVSVAGSGWFRRLAGGVAQAASLSPDLHVHRDMPPAILLQGAEDTVTRAAGAERFCARMRQSHVTCELHVYPGVGHLFTRNLTRQEDPDHAAIDRAVGARADAEALEFLRGMGFIGS